MQTHLKRTNNDQLIHVMDDVLSPNDFQFVVDYCHYELSGGELGEKASSAWSYEDLYTGLIQECVVSKIQPQMDKELYDILNPAFEEAFGESISSRDSQLNYHKFEPGSGINWHNDGGWGGSITFYINEEWSDQYWGFLGYKFDSDSDFTFLQPKPNRAVFMKGSVYHGVSMTSLQSPPRESIQIFFPSE